MRSWQTKHWIILLIMLGAIFTQIQGLAHGWKDATTTTFVGSTGLLVVNNLLALFTDAPRSPETRTRAADVVDKQGV